jgi:hypothetical protein
MSKSDKEAIAKAPARRVRRTPIGRRNVLTVSGKEAGYEYRFVNDEGDRVQEFLDNGWEVVPQNDSLRIGDKRLNAPTGSEGTAAVASVGQGQKAFLLRIRDEYYKEDQAAKQAHVDATEAATKEKALDGNYGKLEITRS